MHEVVYFHIFWIAAICGLDYRKTVFHLNTQTLSIFCMSGIGEFVYPEISVNTRNYIRHNFKPTTIELTYKVGLGGFCRFLCINYEVFV